MRKPTLAVFGIGVLMLGFGCATDKSLRDSYLRSQDQVKERDARIARLNQEIQALKARPDQSSQVAALTAENASLRDKLNGTAKALKALEARLASVEFIKLDAVTDEALRQFAKENPDLVEYDEKRGMVRFRSDLTFGLGSVKISAKAQESLKKLATILSAGAAAKYAVRVAGHTDGVPVKRVKHLHPTNWHLAVHRAIAVRDLLQGSGIAPERTFVVGHGEYRPVAQNDAKGASKKNRRVEIYLVPMPQVDTNLIKPKAS